MPPAPATCSTLWGVYVEEEEQAAAAENWYPAVILNAANETLCSSPTEAARYF